jgi:hypothetical protein
MKIEPKVFVINDSGHDFSGAKSYGKLVFLSKGKVASLPINKYYRHFADKMKDITEHDYILITSLASLNCVAGWVVGSKGLPLNLLLYKDGKYTVRTLKDKL